ncbi:hypothetical protein C2E23DRAFT_818297 [Lenzites betulinus]|nr:hypothetical protein C2E23DRAFT_818297 [Lenzites betulinus]
MLPSYRYEKTRPPMTQHYLRYIARRYLSLVVLAIGVSLLAGGIYYLGEESPVAFRYTYRDLVPTLSTSLPPLYENYHRAELSLPQHHWEQTEARKDEKFLFVAGHSRNCGWGNAMQELLLNAYMAYKSGRAFVFANYTWNADGSQYSEYNGKKIPSLIPYSAIIRGQIVGGSFPPGDDTPLAVHRDYFEAMCRVKTTFIREDISEIINYKNSAKEITDGWRDKLAGVDDPCVQTAIESGQIYNFDVFGDPGAMLDIWPEFSTSPIITRFAWSALVELAFDSNRALFLPATSTESYLSHVPQTHTNAERYSQIDGLMAVHVRRGDFGDHCEWLGAIGATYAAFNAFPTMQDQYIPSRTGNVEVDQAHARPHCFPSVAQIVRRIGEVRRSEAGEGVRRLHVMTNGDRQFVEELRAALLKEGEWPEGVTTSRDLVLDWEQRYVAQGVDMLVGQRAQVFIGNGFSTMTANIVTMRMANGFSSDSTRFW